MDTQISASENSTMKHFRHASKQVIPTLMDIYDPHQNEESSPYSRRNLLVLTMQKLIEESRRYPFVHLNREAVEFLISGIMPVEGFQP